MRMIQLIGWDLTPGPLKDPPPSSVSLQHMEDYPPEIVADAILNFPGIRLLHPAEPSWWEWVARWERESRWIEVGFTLFETDPPYWGGSGLRGRCELPDILGLWFTIRNTVPGCWMHNIDCEIHSPESFAKLMENSP